jgi:Flp pilus assembly protein TadG
MKELIEKIKSFLRTQKVPHKTRRKTRAQSMVEFAVTLPILIALLIGMVEFGFMLNTYLSLLDATRFAARKYSNTNPMKVIVSGSTQTKYYDEDFDDNVVEAIETNLQPADTAARQVPIDEDLDDILVSVVSVNVDTTVNPNTITSINRLTTDAGNPVLFVSAYGNFAALGGTHYTNAVIEEMMADNGVDPVSAGILIVELFYSYEGTLNISTQFFQLFTPGGHMTLYASTIMPLVAVRPIPTPTP